MDKYTLFSKHVSLGVVAHLTRKWGIWETIGEYVQIAQKTVKHTPLEKVEDAWINILAGGRGVVEINTRLRSDKGLGRLFGRRASAEQSTVAETLTACTAQNVEQMQCAYTVLFRRLSQTYRHDYQTELLVDVDLTGLPCGRGAEKAEKGYFAGKKNRRGRQVGRVFATQYNEIIYEELYSGKTQLEVGLQALILAMEARLELTPEKRQRIIIRIDGGGGRTADINWLLERGYRVLARVRQWQRVYKLAQSVTCWQTDPQDARRAWGRVEKPIVYGAPTEQIALRYQQADGSYTYRAIVTNLTAMQAGALIGQTSADPLSPEQKLAVTVKAYDQRGGGVETSFRESKQGLALTKRNKKSFPAQQMLLLLGELAYNLLTWVRTILKTSGQKISSFGLLRLVRDVFAIPGYAIFNDADQLIQLTLYQDHILAQNFRDACLYSAGLDDLPIILGEI